MSSRRLAALLLLSSGLAAGGCKDACDGVDGTCLALHIAADPNEFPSRLPPEFDSIQVQLSGAFDGTRSTSADAGRSELPTNLGISIPEGRNGKLQVDLVGTQRGMRRFIGTGKVELRSGEHSALTVDAHYASSRSGGPDGGPIGDLGTDGGTDGGQDGGPDGGTIASGLRVWLKLDGDVSDASGNGNVGMLYGSVVDSIGRGGLSRTAMHFNATDSLITAPYALAQGDSATITLWAKWGTYVQTMQPLNQELRLLANAVSFTAAGDGALLFAQGELLFRLSSGFLTIQSASFGFPATNQFHHVALVDEQGSFSLYLDGKFQRALKGVPLSTGAASRLWHLGSNGGVYSFQGDIDDFRVYGRALSATEIATLAAETAGP